MCLSRFLVRVPCKHLASHVLGRVLQRLPIDMERRYGYRPWVVETYVAPDQEGTCFKAANFVRIGQTAGGRPGPDGEPEPPKALYVYELDRTWRRRLGVARVEASPVRLPHEGISSEAWAETEFGGAPLGDVRLSARLVKSASMLADVTGGSIVAHTAHDAAAVKGHYRLLESKEGSAVTPGEHSGAAPRAHDRAHAEPEGGALRAGWHEAKLCYAPGLFWIAGHRQLTRQRQRRSVCRFI